MTPKRTAAKIWLENNFSKETGQKRSNIPADHWLSFCTQPHSYYIANWKAGGKETSCKDFTIKYCAQMGIDSRIGALQEATVKGCLAGLGKSYAWVDSQPGLVPEVGDICYWPGGVHVGVSWGAEIGAPTDPQWSNLDVLFWYSVEGGQDQIIFDSIRKEDGTTEKKFSESKSFAWIKWKKYPDASPSIGGLPTGRYTPDMLKGWVGIDRYFYGEDPRTYPQELDSQPAAEDGTISCLWLNQDGQIVHPDAPRGAGGQGIFRNAGPLDDELFDRGLPHPWSPAARYLDPLAVMQFKKDRNEG
jgi:hypothetical protein